MSASLPVNSMGQRVVSASDYTLVRTPNKSQPLVTTFPNGKSTYYVQPARYDSCYRFNTGKGYVGYDGERIAHFGPEHFFTPKTGHIMAAILDQPEPTRPMPIDPILAPNTNMPRKTLVQKHNEVVAYRAFIDTFEQDDPADMAEAETWVNLARAVKYEHMTQVGTALYGPTKFDYSWVTIQSVIDDAKRAKNDPSVNISMHNF